MKAQDIWAAGDYSAIAPHLVSAAEEVVRRAAPGPGEDVLDVACGTGNAALRAAQAGTRVTGLDLTPELLAIARAQAPDITWIEGDAQDLPFADASFDVVLSVFGCMFAPDHQRTAREILRVLRPGGRAVIASWTPEGESARLLRLVGRHLPPPPGDPPVLWGDEEHVRTLFPGARCERAFVHFRFETADDAAEFYVENFGPVVMTGGAANADVHAFFAEVGAEYDAEYLILQATEGGAGRT
jgi:SAM-dependent methyltransferase